MAKIRIDYTETENLPATDETIEVRAWGLGGATHQQFYIGSGLNFSAEANIWLEISYSVHGAQIFYTRNFLHDFSGPRSVAELDEYLEKFMRGETDAYGFGDMLPETSVSLKREKSSYKDGNGEEHQYIDYKLTVSADVGAVLGVETSPGRRMIEICLDSIELEDAVSFMRELNQEIAAAYQGKHPDPNSLPPGSSNWPFVRQLNQQAYDSLSTSYQESYFNNPLLSKAFDGWLAQLPFGGSILDAGCGHGQPVIARLVERGFRVTGTDLSPEMLRRASEQFPQVQFLNQAITDISFDTEFDGACSFSSMLYLDPIDLAHSILRLRCALKPGGLLFLHAYDLHPSWRGLPYKVDVGRWMWSWSYGVDEAAKALGEHGDFEVITKLNVITSEIRDKLISRWRENREKEYNELLSHLTPGAETPDPPDLSVTPQNLAYPYVIIARRSER